MPTPRKPTELKRLHGETRPSRLNVNEPKPGGVPVAPAWLSDEVRAVWDYTLTDPGARVLITSADVAVFAVYCQAVVHHARALQLVAEYGMTRTGSHDQVVKHPAMSLVRDQAALVRSLGNELGLNPAARMHITGGSIISPPRPGGGPRADRLLT